MKLTVLLLVAISSNLASSFDLKCGYKMKIFNATEKIQCCYPEELNIQVSNMKIERVVGRSEPAYDVKAFWIIKEVCHFVPKAIAEFFPALEVFGIVKSGLRSITKSDLEPFPELSRIALTGNELSSVDYNLFAFNSKLERVSLDDNNIQILDPDIFKTLPNLPFLDVIVGCMIIKCHSGYDGSQDTKFRIPEPCGEQEEPVEICKNEIWNTRYPGSGILFNEYVVSLVKCHKVFLDMVYKKENREVKSKALGSKL